jgi:SNF2 family DNA or RNA helicase
MSDGQGWVTDVQGASLRTYQVEGVNWLLNLHRSGVSGILADEMVCVSSLVFSSSSRR